MRQRHAGAGARGPHRRGPRPDAGKRAGGRDAGLLRRAHTTCCCAPPSWKAGWTCREANTLIVFDADHFGLSQLYQIRGRVGRSSRQAYAYFTVRANKSLSETAQTAAERHSGVHRVRRGLPHRHARSGDPRRRRRAGPGAERPPERRGLRHVRQADRAGGGGGSGQGADLPSWTPAWS